MALLLSSSPKPCLVLGLNSEALAMIENLVAESFTVECASNVIEPEMLNSLSALGVNHVEKSYSNDLLEGKSCVMCFSEKHEVVEQVINDSHLRALPLYINGDAVRPTLRYCSSAHYRQTRIVIEEVNGEQLKGANSGEVYLVGAGPGDPDLLTFKALKLMQKADVVLYDRLVSEPVLALVNKRAEKLYVGKRRQDHALPQMEINQKLVELAQAGKKVLRLKGGDPFIFGRGGEEIDLLSENNIAFQVVPGITAASGCSAYSGIPLTHRDHAQSVRFITGHTKTDKVNLNWHHFTDASETLVFYMGLVHLEQICQQLINCGREPSTPAALIEKGTTDKQKLIAATLSDLPRLVREAKLKAPTLLIVGDVVKLHKKLNWFVHE